MVKCDYLKQYVLVGGSYFFRISVEGLVALLGKAFALRVGANFLEDESEKAASESAASAILMVERARELALGALGPSHGLIRVLEDQAREFKAVGQVTSGYAKEQGNPPHQTLFDSVLGGPR